MLELKDIRKQYKTGDLIQTALDGVSLNLRDNEFVSILGPSGSGKTTLLNIIGGLDRYDSGDLAINGRSTKQYKDRDWDTYRNHTIGFVFQSYNLIPHQSILANVELALTIGGISRTERRKRAKAALEEVGLGGQFHKRPNQMSGGQMQRVAIARALVNDPDILLADEPTGALDSETSLQVMELLKKVAEKRLVVMVTHNGELAEQYSTRIVKLRDGRITDDSDPFTPQEQAPQKDTKSGKARMSFFTAMALSFNNLRTKKGRTLLTSFAGSIGIIGIALILALSTGVNTYISDIQKDTMASYPITLTAKTMDMSELIGMRGSQMGSRDEEHPDRVGVYADHRLLETEQALTQSITENDLTAFKKYLDDPNSEIAQYIGENGVVYSYNVQFDVFSRDANGKLVDTNADPADLKGKDETGFGEMMSNMSMMSFMSGNGAKNFTEMTKGNNTLISPVVTDQFELLYGDWPQKYNEVVLILDRSNAIETGTLYQLGLITADEYLEISEQIENDKKGTELRFDYKDVCAHRFLLVPACDRYIKNEDGTYRLIGDSADEEDDRIQNAIELKISGIIRPSGDRSLTGINAPIAYTAALTDHIIEYTDKSPIVAAQEKNKKKNVLTGMAFEAPTDKQKIADVKEYIGNMGVSDKASLWKLILYYQSTAQKTSSTTTTTTATATAPVGMTGMTGTTGMTGIPGGMSAGTPGAVADESTMAKMLDAWLKNSPDNEILLSLYDKYIAGSTYEDNMEAFGKVSYDAPGTISIYTDSFEDKDKIAECIENYNKNVKEEQRITYTDYVALLTSSITSIVDVISYVLIAFVAVSLVVSCIMIGIITHISVLERTKEIGILRAIGASKKNISQVFNAETVIIGLCSGVIGVVLSWLLTFPINAVIASLLNGVEVRAQLMPTHAVILVVISVIITLIGGLIPAKKAAKKDPVIALRTE